MRYALSRPTKIAAFALAALLAVSLCSCQRHQAQAKIAVDKLMLVNPWNAFPQGTPAGLVNIADSIQCENLKLKNDAMLAQGEAVEALARMAEAMAKDQVGPLRLVSAYRSIEYQQGLYQNKVQRVIASGTPEDDAEDAAAREVARPGYSEHHTGYAFDFSGADGTLDSFYQSDAYRWVAEHGAQYGFIIRYPEEKSSITGIIYEPWHLRYVGPEAAQAMASQGLCLEEYLKKQS